MFQRVTLIGRVGKEPEMRYTPDGAPVTSFSLATTTRRSKERVPNCPEGWKESYNGRAWELTTWWRITCWRELAETVNQYVNKGKLVFIEGEIKGEAVNGSQNPRVWTDNGGVARASFEVTARNVLFLSGREEAAASEPDEDGSEPGGFQPDTNEAMPF